MQTSWDGSGFEAMVRRSSTGLIRGYRRYLSPRKGFACAHRLRHGGESCSDYVQRLFSEERLERIPQAALQRFSACVDASRRLRADRSGFRCVVIPCCIPL